MSECFGDGHPTDNVALSRSRDLFLAGCGLPQAWAGAAQWRVLETDFGFGLNFLATWSAWRNDPQRARLLHFVSIEAHPVAPDDLVRAAAADPELAVLAQLLAAQWHGLLPGFHRLAFDEGRVLLTLCIGDVQAMLRAQRFEADSIFLDGFPPGRHPAPGSADTLTAVSRFARRGTRIATGTTDRTVHDVLAQTGFRFQIVDAHERPPPERDGLQGVYDPAWTPRRRQPDTGTATPGHCLVIGAGIAGAAVAASLARRGWRVSVLDAGAQPAAGASGLPAGVMAPHVSPDDALLSRLTRAGVRATWQQLATWLREGEDWGATGVIERRSTTDMRLPAGWSAQGPNDSWPATAAQLSAAGLPLDTPALWHARGAWVKPARLVAAWLAQPGIVFRPGCRIDRLARLPAGGWAALDADGATLATADRVVVAAGIDSLRFASGLALQPVRGQVSWGRMADAPGLPSTPLNGDGHLIAQVPDASGDIWLTGATFDRDDRDTRTREADVDANRERLARLHPAAAASLSHAFDDGHVASWAGVRCVSGDRRPLVGPCDPTDAEGLWVCTAMGSRGLSFAALCAELLAARWHAEPLPLPARLAAALDTARAATSVTKRSN